MIEPSVYWQVRARTLELEKLDQQRGQLLAVLRDLFVAAGLDPLGTYRCDDATCQLIPAGQAQASRAGGTADA